jgi:hypothetical protein
MSFGGGGGDEILRKQIELMVQSNPQVVQVLENAINGAQASLANFSQTSAQSNAVNTDTIRVINQMAAQIESLQRVHNLATGAAGTNTAAWVRFAYLTSQGVEDVQYSFAALANNIPGIAQSFAQAMGLSTTSAMAWAAGLSAAATAVNIILVPAIRSIVDTSPGLQGFFRSLNAQLNPLYVQKYGDEISTLTARIKELEGKKVRLAVDTAELDRLKDELREAKKDKEAFDDAMTGRSKAEREAGKAVEEALAAAPAGEPEITARIAAQFAQQGRAESPKLREKRDQLAELKRYRATLDPNALVDRTKIEEADRQITQAIDESLSIQTAISENAKGQAGHMLRMAKEGRAPDVEKLLPFLRGFEKAPDIGIGPVAGDLSKQVETAADRAREQVAIDRDMPALKKVADENKRIADAKERADEATRVGQIQAVVGAFGPKLRDAMQERGAQLIKEGKSDDEIKNALKAMVAERLKVGQVAPQLIDVGAGQIAAQGVAALEGAIGGRVGAGRAEAAGEVLADIEEKRKRAEEAQAARERRRAAPTPEEREHQREVEKQARALEGGRGGLAEQLSPAILARMARGQDVETIVAGLAPQVAGRVGRIPTVPAGMAPDISRQIVQDVLAKQGAPMAGEMAFAPNAQFAAMGLQTGNAAKAMERAQQQGKRADAAQQAVQERGLAQMFAAQGATNQQALTMAHRTVNLMQHGLGMQAAMLTAWNEMNHRLGQLEAQQQRLMQQQMRTRRRANLLNRGGPAG